MKGKKFENIALALGSIFLLGGVGATFFKLGYENIIFPVAFLFYILYSMQSSTNYNKEIRALNNHVDSLKAEAERYKKQIAEKDQQIAALNAQVNDLSANVKSLEKDKAALSQELDSLKTQLENSED